MTVPDGLSNIDSPEKSTDGNAFKSSGGVGSDPESGLLQYTVTFTKAGSYPFVCLVHPKMGGVVQVS